MERKMKSFQKMFYITAIIALGSPLAAIPVEPSSAVEAGEVINRKTVATESTEASVTEKNNKVPASEKAKAPVSDPTKDLETSNSHQTPTYVFPTQQTSGDINGGAIDPAIYPGFLTPEAFQQYLAQFASSFAPYGYPAYGPAPVYPAPYTVQTGYDGFLVPSTSLSASGTVSSSSGNILTALSNLIPTLMESPIFRVIISVLGALLMILLGGAVTTAICNLTPLCDISFKAITYLRGKGSPKMAHMLVEEITPERVKRAAELVHSAIHKYKELQKVMAEEKTLN